MAARKVLPVSPINIFAGCQFQIVNKDLFIESFEFYNE